MKLRIASLVLFSAFAAGPIQAQNQAAGSGFVTTAPDGHTMTAAERGQCHMAGVAIVDIAKHMHSNFDMAMDFVVEGEGIRDAFADMPDPSDDQLKKLETSGLVPLVKWARQKCLAPAAS